MVAGMEVTDYLEAAPMRWEATVNKAFKKKEEIFPLQTAESEQIKVQIEAFSRAVTKFRNHFRATAPFAFAPNWRRTDSTLTIGSVKAVIFCGPSRGSDGDWVSPQ